MDGVGAPPSATSSSSLSTSPPNASLLANGVGQKKGKQHIKGFFERFSRVQKKDYPGALAPTTTSSTAESPREGGERHSCSVTLISSHINGVNSPDVEVTSRIEKSPTLRPRSLSLIELQRLKEARLKLQGEVDKAATAPAITNQATSGAESELKSAEAKPPDLRRCVSDH